MNLKHNDITKLSIEAADVLYNPVAILSTIIPVQPTLQQSVWI